MKKTFTSKLPALLLGLTLATTMTSCLKDLDRDPPLNQFTTEQAYRDPKNYKAILAKIYASLVIAGQNGPNGDADIKGLDGGTSPFLRTMWYLQELTTDEAVWANGDDISGNVGLLHTNQVGPSNSIVQFMYVRAYFTIGLCNEYLRQTTDDKLSERGISGVDADRAREYRTDARFMRALMYEYVVDMYGKGPFVQETDPVGYFLPKQASRQELFNFVESELKAVEGTLPDRGAVEYGRASKGAAQTALAHLYLNAQVYTGQERWTDCMAYAQKVMDQGYVLNPTYANLFKADNNVTSVDEIIFPLACDGLRTQSYGSTTFLVNGQIVGLMSGLNFGVSSSGWQQLRVRRNIPLMFADSAQIFSGTPLPDLRANFFTRRQSLNIGLGELSNKAKGLPAQKWSNKTSTGVNGADQTFVDTDFPLMRLGEVYLMYAEAAVRSNSNLGNALELVNKVRRRAYGFDINTPNPTSDVASIDEDYIFRERTRELYWEGYRRSDLVRFGRYTSASYLWPHKGGVVKGTALPDTRNLFPIPAFDLIANPNMSQNPGY